MKVLYNSKQKCFGCGACAAACPSGAIVMEADSEGFCYPCVKEALCTDCGRCEAVCPARTSLAQREGNVYAVRCQDQALLERSTSGGAFTLLAREVLARDGRVCGAVFAEDFSVQHVLSQNIASMRKSKYVQSDLSGCYADIRNALEERRPVLFSGTPCQCHGIKQVFSEYRGRLILLSLVCRGVQSPGLWKDYVNWLSRGGILEAYDFRDKRHQNDGHSISYTINGTETVVPMAADRLSRLYNSGLISRPSCYACPYARRDNDFDITMGDFWGIETVCPSLADGWGSSLLIVRSQWGEELLSAIREHAQVMPCEPDAGIQPALEGPAKEPFLRKFLFRDYARKTAEGRCDIPLILKKYALDKLNDLT